MVRSIYDVACQFSSIELTFPLLEDLYLLDRLAGIILFFRLPSKPHVHHLRMTRSMYYTHLGGRAIARGLYTAS